MTLRDLARDTADTALGFARVTASSILSAAYSLALDLIIAEDDDETGETMPEADVYGEAALLFRPADADASGAPEVIVWRHGDERVVIATKDRRWQVELEKGDVCLRAFGANKPRLFLRADGTAVLEAEEVYLANGAATDKVALATPVNSRNDDVAAALDALAAAVPVPNDGGAAIQTAFKAVWGTGAPPTPASDVGAQKVYAE